MKSIIFCFVIVMAALGCKNNDEENLLKSACNCDDPIDKVDWMIALKNSMTNCSCEVSLIQGTYNDQIVYFVAMTDPLCNGINTPALYNCDGHVIRQFTDEDYQDFYNEVSCDSVLYRCKTEK
jgi:hypothetical protein